MTKPTPDRDREKYKDYKHDDKFSWFELIGTFIAPLFLLYLWLTH